MDTKQDLVEWAIIEIKASMEDLILYRTQETREILLKDILTELVKKSYNHGSKMKKERTDRVGVEIAELRAEIKELKRKLLYSRVAEKKACSSFVRLNQHMTHDQIADIFDDWA